ncbi:MAG: hypothetical protein QOC66_265 [Pseudonocardiales bacterium]|nr:hypothetical protein [Pseudonocardiales bacterium]
MTARWQNPSAFRADPAATPGLTSTLRQTIALIVVLVLAAGAVAVASYLIRPEKARSFSLFHGSLFLADQKSPVAVDLASGKPTLRLLGADKQVGITGTQPLGVVPLDGRTLLLNQASGEFNMVDNSGFVVKHDGGVPLATRAGESSSFGVAAGNGQAYIVRTAPTGGTDVYLVNQPTVESAINATRSVRPRASASMTDAGSTAAGAAAAADGDLWLLVGGTAGTGPRTIRQLTVPADSSAGAELTSSDHGSVDGPAAIGTATTGRDGSGPTVAAVASDDRIRVFPPGADPQTLTYRAPAGVDTVLPTTGGQGVLAFLLHGTDGWSVVSVDADGSGLRAPKLLDGVPGDATPAPPAASHGALYAIDRSTGQILRIGYDGKVQSVPGASTYPLSSLGGRVVEQTDFSDAYAISRGSRVVFNSASHANALILFADGSRKPEQIAKSSAVTINAAGGAEALTKSTVNPNQQPGKTPQPGEPKPKPQNNQSINNKIDCKTAKQKPHIPVITSAVPGSRTVALNWNYPLLDNQDCYPSTYLVSVKLISNDAPQPPSSVRIQSQTGTNLSGLFPSTQYEITVTAFINGEGTPSVPVRITTGREGPAAPSGLAVSADASGNWHVSWNSCGGISEGCVPAQSWTVTPSYCDERGVSSPPTPMTVTADPTARRQPPATYRGNDDLLGRGLQFQVQGTGDAGQAGTPSAKSACVYSWTPPVQGALSVAASSPPATSSSDDTTSTTVTVKFAHGQVHDLGGVGGTLTYQLLSEGSVTSQRGPTTDASVALPGIRAGHRYQVKVLASPPRHSTVVMTVGPEDVVPAVAEWPEVNISAVTFDAPAGVSGTLHVKFGFPVGTNTHGETFALVNSQVRCGNTGNPLERSDVAPGDDLTFSISRVDTNGDDCQVTIQLAQDSRTATDPPLYGAGYSHAVSSSTFTIPPPSLTSTDSDFTAQWAGTTGQPQIVVAYHGGDPLSGASNWQMTVSNPSDSDCGSATDPPPTTIDVDKSCVKAGGPFTVDISYRYFVLGQAHFTVAVGGTAPQPVDPAKISFTAAWNTNPQLPQVDLTYTGSEDAASLAPLEWTETVKSGATVCATENDNPATSSARIDVDLTTCPPTATDGTASVYTVDISFTDPNYGQTGTYSYTVMGTPPT